MNLKKTGSGVSEKLFKGVDGRQRTASDDHNSSSEAFCSGELKIYTLLESSHRGNFIEYIQGIIWYIPIIHVSIGTPKLDTLTIRKNNYLS